MKIRIQFGNILYSTITTQFYQLRRRWRLNIRSLVYNENFTRDDCLEACCLQPCTWCFGCCQNVAGPIFVAVVCFLTLSVVVLAYWIGIRYWWEKSPTFTIVLAILGNWILINIIFHYYMAATTSPGHPPNNEFIKNAVGICRKCIAPKPPRTHHCSACDRCVLKMDHHCPWMNNCIGYFNHRYFFMYMAYTLLGIAYLACFGLIIAFEALWMATMSFDPFLFYRFQEQIITRSGTPTYFNETQGPLYYNNTNIIDDMISMSFKTKTTPKTRIKFTIWDQLFIRYMVFINLVAFIFLATLFAIHITMITNGATSVETRIQETHKEHPQAAKLPFGNPYDLGPKTNWKIFFGLTENRSWWRCILLPSTHPPNGDGLTWQTVYDI